jgi:hypothetical protein
MTAPERDARRDLCDTAAVTRGAVEDLRSAFQDHKARLSPEARDEMDAAIEGLENLADEFEMLAEDDDSYAQAEVSP